MNWTRLFRCRGATGASLTLVLVVQAMNSFSDNFVKMLMIVFAHSVAKGTFYGTSCRPASGSSLAAYIFFAPSRDIFGPAFEAGVFSGAGCPAVIPVFHRRPGCGAGPGCPEPGWLFFFWPLRPPFCAGQDGILKIWRVPQARTDQRSAAMTMLAHPGGLCIGRRLFGCNEKGPIPGTWP